MTYLELFQAFYDELLDTGEEVPSGAIGDLTGENAKYARWIRETWVEIQNVTTWRWMRREFVLFLEPGVRRYHHSKCLDRERYENYIANSVSGGSSATAAAEEAKEQDGIKIARLKSWVYDRQNRWSNRRESEPEDLDAEWTGELTHLRWSRMQGRQYYAASEQEIPAYYAVDPQDRIILSGKPVASEDGINRFIVGEYNAAAQQLVDSDDVPEMPEDYHLAIMYRALKRYGHTQAEPTALSEAAEMGRMKLQQLLTTQGPKMRTAAPMA